MTNWLLSHAVRTLHSCPEEFFELLPVVSNLEIFLGKLITHVTANFVFFLQIILFDSQEDDPELQHYCHRVSRVQIDSILACIVGSGGTVASWLLRSPPDRAVWVRALAGDIVFWARHFTLLLLPSLLSPPPLSTQVYQWVLANVLLAGNPEMD